jgi:hypothetical protein
MRLRMRIDVEDTMLLYTLAKGKGVPRQTEVVQGVQVG